MKCRGYIYAIFTVLALFVSVPQAQSAGDAKHAEELEWSFNGATGTYDKAALQRGFKVYQQVCSACHAMKYVYYRNLSALGYSDAEIKAIASEYTVMDGPDDEGEMFERPAKASDRFVSPYQNDKQAAAVNNGAVPPDMSLLALARHGGPDYIHAILTGYGHAPEGKELLTGQYWNDYMPGNIIAMAPPLSDGMIEYTDGSAQTVEQYAKDVSHFLAWASSPDLESRKRTGVKVFLFLLVFAGVMYSVKKKVWANAH